MFSNNGLHHVNDLHLPPTYVVCATFQKVHAKQKSYGTH